VGEGGGEFSGLPGVETTTGALDIIDEWADNDFLLANEGKVSDSVFTRVTVVLASVDRLLCSAVNAAAEEERPRDSDNRVLTTRLIMIIIIILLSVY
jgi:hypothetical protein